MLNLIDGSVIVVSRDVNVQGIMILALQSL